MAQKRPERNDWSNGALWTAAAMLFAGGVLNDPPWHFFSPTQNFAADHGESFRVAMSLYRDSAFANPFGSLATGPTAHVAPAYPFLQALLLRLFGDQASGWLAIQVLGTAVQSAQYALLPWLARRLGMSAWTGILAALLGIWVKAGREEFWEGQLAGLLMMLLTGWMLRPDWRTGVAAGIAFLVQPVLSMAYFLWAAMSRRWVLIAIPVAVCLPWIARTYVATGGPAWVRGNLGIELHVAFNDCAPYGIRQSELAVCFPVLHPNVNRAEAEKVLALGEYRYNQDKLREALVWMTAHPARTAALIGQRVWYFWFPADFGWESYASQRKRFATVHFLTVLSFVGLALMWLRRMTTAGLLTVWMGAFPLIYYLVQFEVRYRSPLLWLVYLLAAFVVQVTVEKARGEQPSRVTMKVPRNATV